MSLESPKEKRESLVQKKKFKEISENVPNLVKELDLGIQEAQ